METNKLSPKFLEDLEKNGIKLTEEELKSLNKVLPNSASELTFEQLDSVVSGGMSTLKKVGIGAAIVTTAVLADAAQAYYRNNYKTKNMSKKSILIPTAKKVGSIANNIANNSFVAIHVDATELLSNIINGKK